MEIRLLEKGYKDNEQLYQDFLAGTIDPGNDYFSNKMVYIKEAPDFPIYMAKGSDAEKRTDFLKTFRTIAQSYLAAERDVIFDETFWHSLLVTHKRDYILEHYPEVQDGISKFRNIVLKAFDWENYIYKSILAAQYIADNVLEAAHEKYYALIIENLDVFNYIIKYEVFRNDQFLIRILEIIDELNLSKLMKAKIKGREDLGDDERYGRRVLFEFNKSYPVVMAPILEKDELKKLFITYLGYYYNPDQEEEQQPEVQDDIYQEEAIGLKGNYVPTQSSNIGGEHPVAAEAAIGVKEKMEQDDLVAYLENQRLEYVDHRAKGGSIWVIGDRRIESSLKPLKESGIRFRFKATGGRASRNRPAWFWFEK